MKSEKVKVNSDWKETTLGEVAEFSNGRTSPERFDSGKYEVFGSNGVIGLSDEINSDENTIIIGRVGSYCGSLYFSKNRCWVTDNAIKANAKENNDPFYLYYLLITQQLNKKAAGSGQPLINQEILNSIEVTVPPLPEQKTIAAVLSSFDDKIELLRRQNKTLEAMAQAIFKEWFIKFNFPVEFEVKNEKLKVKRGGKETNGEKLKANSKTGLSACGDAQAGLPEGWRMGKLEEIAKVEWGNTNLTKRSYSNEGKYIGVSASGCDGRIEHKEYNFGSFVISAIGEYCGKLFYPPDDFTAIKNTLVVTQANSKYSAFAYYGLQRWNLEKHGAAQPFITKGDTEQLEIIIPTQEVLESFDKITEPLVLKIRNNFSQIQTLSKLRDTLLPKLMKGEIRVR